MEKETLNILSSAISDVGYWRWWITEGDRIQLEFGGVQLLNNDTLDKNSTSAIIALRFSENVLLKFYHNMQECQWHIKLQEDEIEPFTVDYDFFRFNHLDSVNDIEKEFTNQIVIDEEKINERHKLWWIFWRDYWKKRNSDEPYNRDYACEVTIPLEEK